LVPIHYVDGCGRQACKNLIQWLFCFYKPPCLLSQEHPIKHENPALLVVLILVTCGIFYFIMLYRWIAAINDASDKPLVDPAVGIFLSIVACGIAAIFYEYEIVARAQRIARKPLP